MPYEQPIFVVGTGRCGSTMISNMLREHPKILSISEFFTFITDLGSLIPPAFPVDTISNSQFREILGAFYRKQNIMIRNYVEMDEFLYPFTLSSRYTRETGVPALLQTTLPHLTHEHDAIFDETMVFVETLPDATIYQHYLRLFEWLKRRFDKQIWVERSGSSLRIAHRLQQFPNAKFIHLIRDGRDCSISMSRHYGFRMALIAFQLTEVLGCDPFEDENRVLEADLFDELIPFLPEYFDANAFRNYEMSPSFCGHYWSGELKAGFDVLSQLPSDRVLTLYYEDFLAHPEDLVRTLIQFIGPEFVDDAWIAKAASLVRPSAKSSWKNLAPQELRLLEKACEPGFEIMSRIG